ncbi:MAG TPA: DMT family transporter [Solirubrobacteraceae bacterium]|nr:DMT family transporter [Solirubrobacteraceae bacterium]
MIAILGGLGAAICWSVSTLCSSRSSRRLDPLVVVAWMMLVGLVITAPLAVAAGSPDRAPASAWAWLAISGGGNVAGLVLVYRAMHHGQVSLVAPLVSTEGAIAGVIALLAGERVAPAALVTLAVIAAGVCVAAVPARTPAGQPVSPHRAGHARAVGLAALAAVVFGASLYATGRAGTELPSAWVVLAARVVGTVALAVPLALAGRLRIAPGTAPLLLASGVAEVLGFFSFTWGAGHGIAIASVLSSQFAALSLLGAYLVFGERLGRLQLGGVAVVIVAVAVLSGLRA